MVQTPVGARCRKCAGLRRLPTYEITHRQYLKAIGVGLGLAIGVGIAWGWLRDLVSLSLSGLQFGILWGAPAGYAIGELLSLSVNHKRGRVLQVIGATAVVLSYIVSRIEISSGGLILFAHFSSWDILALALGISIATSRLK